MEEKMNKTKKLVLAAVITAIILLLGFTPLGYIKIATIEVTILMIPVVIGAMLLGPAYGAFFGFVFGATSFLQCFGLSLFGATMLSVNPFFTFICTIVPRVLMGWLSGLIFQALSRVDKTKIVSFIVTSISGALLNTIFFTTCFLLFFRNANLEGMSLDLSAFSIIDIILMLVTFNAILEIIICGVIGTALSKVLAIYLPKLGKRKETT
jgi:predicted membrane protein